MARPGFFFYQRAMKIVLSTLLIISIAACKPASAPQLAISDAWARPTISTSQAAAVYLTVRNDGDAPDRLTSVTTDIGSASLHQSGTTNGIMRMRALVAVPVPAHGSSKLAPGGMHIMIEGLRAPLRSGEQFKVKLGFERSEDRDVLVQVSPALTEGGLSHEH